MCSKAEEKSKVVCKVCGSELELTKKNHYVVTDNLKKGVIAIAALTGTEEQWYDAFDCPTCGSQYIAGERKRKVRNVIFRELQEDLVSDNVIEEDLFDEEPENSDFDCFGNYNEDCSIPVTCEKYYECRKATPIKSTEEGYDRNPDYPTPSCFGKELEDADEECIGCEQIESCLLVPKCFGSRDGIKFVNEVCCKCNAKVRNKCSKIYNEVMKNKSNEQEKEEGYDKNPKVIPSCFGKELSEANEECIDCKHLADCFNASKCFGEKGLLKEILKGEQTAQNEQNKAYPVCIGDQAVIEENGVICRTCDSREECIRRINEAHEQEEDIWQDDDEL